MPSALDDVDAILNVGEAVASREHVVYVLGRHRADAEIRSGRLRAVFPRVYARPWDVDDVNVRLRAALTSVGGDVALSHLTVLAQFGLLVPPERIHVTAYLPRHPRGHADQLTVHRTRQPLEAFHVNGLPVVRLERSLAVSWPLLAGPGQRGPMIEAARRGLLDRRRLADTVESMWWVPGRRDLRALVSHVLAGCESELELWGYLEVFDIPGLRDAARQRVVRVGSRSYRLDMAYDDERLAVELDGRAYHATTERWEGDIARDLALATIGWQTIRLSHHRLTSDVAGCRRDVLAVRAARRTIARSS